LDFWWIAEALSPRDPIFRAGDKHGVVLAELTNHMSVMLGFTEARDGAATRKF
jgi:hypothetical protein